MQRLKDKISISSFSLPHTLCTLKWQGLTIDCSCMCDRIYTCFYCVVIGRQGEMINKLQAESAARIQVAPGNIYIKHLELQLPRLCVQR